MKLADYLSLHGLSQSAFAKRLDVSHVAVGRWVKGERIPDPPSMRLILTHTSGAVTPNDFVSVAGIDPQSDDATKDEAAA